MRAVPLSTLLLAFSSACGPFYNGASTSADNIQQLAPGQSMLSAAPIKGYGGRLTFGVAQQAEGDPSSSKGGATLYAPRLSLGGDLALRLGAVELGGVYLQGQESYADSERHSKQYALRFRAAPGGDDFRFGISFEFGIKHDQF